MTSDFTGLRCLFALCLLGLGACAKTGEPQPPQVLVPKPATDLVARQFSDRVLLSVSMPTQNTNGTRVTTLGRVEVFRMTVGRGNPGIVPETALLAQAAEISSVSAANLARYLRGDTLSFWDSSTSDPLEFYKEAFVYAVRFVNMRNQTAGLGNQVFVAPVPIPDAPGDLTDKYTADTILLSWKPPGKNADGSTPARIVGYNVYRSEDPKSFPTGPLNAEPLLSPEFADRNFEFDKTFYYAVSVVGSRANPYAESLPSNPLPVPTPDIFPPGKPKNLDAVVQGGAVTLMWEAPDDKDLAGYRVYRKEDESGARILLQAELIVTLSLRDDQVRPGKKYEYSVTAVDTHKNEGPAATFVVEIQ